jgi:hypothetical protein
MTPKKFFSILFVVAFALDFRGASSTSISAAAAASGGQTAGGTALQVVMAATNSLSFLMLATANRVKLPRSGLATALLWVWLAMLVTGTFGAMVNTTTVFTSWARILYPFTLFLEGFLVSWWATKDPSVVKGLMSAMVAAACVSLVFTCWWGFYHTGDSAEDIRYEILSPLIPFLLVTTGYDLLIARERMFRSGGILFAVLLIIGLSVTRGLILVAAIVGTVVMLAWMVNVVRGDGRIPKRIIKSLLTIFAGLTSVVVFALVFGQHQIMRWEQRSTGPTSDVTLYTRIAAVVGQYKALTASTWGWLCGQGFGSSYPWPVWLFPSITPYLGNAKEAATFPGEFMWMTFLYYGGFLVGSAAIVVFVWCALRGFGLVRRLIRQRSWRGPRDRVLWAGSLGFLAFLASATTANPFITRLASLFFGLCLGLMISGYEELMWKRSK